MSKKWVFGEKLRESMGDVGRRRIQKDKGLDLGAEPPCTKLCNVLPRRGGGTHTHIEYTRIRLISMYRVADKWAKILTDR